MNIKLQLPKLMHLRPKITVVGVGGAGSNAVNNMIASGLTGVNFVVANTDAQSLANSGAENRIQLGAALTEGLGAGAKPEIGKASAEEACEEIRTHVAGSHMVFVAAGMGGGTGTGAAAVIARIARECGALTVGVVTKPFHFEGTRRMRAAEAGIAALKPEVDTLLVIPNQNLFRIANERTTFAEAFVLADQVLYSGIACVVDLIVKEGLINLDFADVRTIMSGMGTAMMGTGEASGEKRAVIAAEEAISNPLLDDISLRGARGLLVSITGSRDLKLYEVDEAATRVRQEVDGEANIIVGATFDDTLGDRIRVSIVASGMERRSESAPNWGSTVPQPAATSPAVPDNQPPFIEPYPEPYAISPPGPALPSLHEPQASQQFEAVTVPSAASAPAHAQLPHRDFARALSEALEPGSDLPNEAAQAGAWASQSGAVFEDAQPQVSSSPVPPLSQLPMNRLPSGEASFHPKSPAETPRSTRRLPEVDDFPVIGQREYRAKSAQYAEPPQAPPRAYAHPTPQPERKRGFFERLMGSRKKQSPEPEQAASYQQASRSVAQSPDSYARDDRSRSVNGAREAVQQDQEPARLPVFFGSDRK